MTHLDDIILKTTPPTGGGGEVESHRPSSSNGLDVDTGSLVVVERVEIAMIDLVPAAKRTDALQAFTSQQTPIVRVYDSDGGIGVGYSYTIGVGGSSVVALLRDHLAPRLIGRDVRDIEAVWLDLKRSINSLTVGPVASLALAAIDTALWDLRCVRVGLPLWRLAGGAQQTIPVYSTEGGWLHLTDDELVENALADKANGFLGTKIKLGRPGIRTDVVRLEKVRAAVGDDFSIMTDCNQSLRRDDAIRLCQAAGHLDLAWIEEPFAADDIGAHASLARAFRIPVAVGESLYSLAQFADYVARGACDVVQVDVGRIGGITPWLKVAHLAEAFNLPVAPHFLMELHVSLACAVPAGRWLEHIPQLNDIVAAPIEIIDGRARPSSAAGIGIAWDWPRVDSMIVGGRWDAIA